jgi:hypothetical protein
MAVVENQGVEGGGEANHAEKKDIKTILLAGILIVSFLNLLLLAYFLIF